MVSLELNRGSTSSTVNFCNPRPARPETAVGRTETATSVEKLRCAVGFSAKVQTFFRKFHRTTFRCRGFPSEGTAPGRQISVVMATTVGEGGHLRDKAGVLYIGNGLSNSCRQVAGDCTGLRMRQFNRSFFERPNPMSLHECVNTTGIKYGCWTHY